MSQTSRLRARALVGLLLLTIVASALHLELSSLVRAQSEEGLVVLLNARNPTNTLPLSEAKKVFLGQTAFWHGVVPVKVFVRSDSSPPAKALYALIGVTAQAFHKNWDELQLAGRGVSPKSFATIQEAAQNVAQSPGGITFALASEAWNMQVKGVKVIPIR